jgi:hypothetical protein
MNGHAFGRSHSIKDGIEPILPVQPVDNPNKVNGVVGIRENAVNNPRFGVNHVAPNEEKPDNEGQTVKRRSKRGTQT